MPLKRVGVDVHAMLGGAGLLAAVSLDHWSTLAGCLAAVATAAYMSLRAVREWVKLRSELRAKERTDETANKNENKNHHSGAAARSGNHHHGLRD
jgi:hypothetical protein